MNEQLNIKITTGMKIAIVMRAEQYGCTQAEFVRWCIAEILDKKIGPVPIAVTKSLAEY